MRAYGMLVAALAGLSFSPIAAAPVSSENYPARPVTFVVPLPPGGTLDPITRVITAKLAERLGKPVVVRNQSGAGTVIGTEAVARATPDGHTILMGGTAGLAANVRLFKRLPYDPVADFEPIALVYRTPLILVVHPSLPVHSVPDLVRLAREKPGQIFYASAGIGTQPHLAMELLQIMTNIQTVHVAYKGAQIGMLDVLAGQVQAIFSDPASALPQIRSGKLRALGVSSAVRMPAAPEIPTIAETGLPGFEASVWIMAVAPANTPREIIVRLHNEIRAIIAMQEVQQRIVSLGAIPIESPPPEQLRGFLKSEIERMGRLIEQAGLSGSQ